MVLNKLLGKLLSRQISAWQLVGFSLANLCGLTIVLCAVQFSVDVLPLFSKGDSFMKPGQIVVVQRVSAMRTMLNAAPVFTESQIDDLRSQPFVKKMGQFTPSQYGVVATVGSRSMGMEFSTEMFFESVPDEFVDVDTKRWTYANGSDTVPIILPRNYLNLYNFGFAGSRGLPTLSEGLISLVPIRITLQGTQEVLHLTGRVAAFSKRLNTILVPENFMREMNAVLSPDKTPQVSRLIVEVDNPADERISNYLNRHSLDTEGTDADASRTVTLLRLLTTIVGIVGLLITALAFYVLLLSILLLLQKQTYKIDTLLLLGYAPKAIARPYLLLAFSLNALFLVLSLCAVVSVRNYYLPQFGELYPKYEATTFLPTLLVGASIFLLLTLLNHTLITRRIKNIWLVHQEK